MSSSNRLLQFLAIFSVVFVCFKIYYKIHDTPKNGDSDDSDQDSWFLVSNKTEIFDNWRECVKLKLMGLEDPVEFWKQFVDSTRKCDEEAQISKLGVTELEEQKIVIFPKNEDENNHNIITLGVGQSTIGEESYQRKMQKLNKNVDFFGADSTVDKNSEIYSKFGKFFPFAVARHPGFTNSSIEKNGELIDQNVAHVDILYFLKDILNVQKIDNLWIDAEGAEYELFEIFDKNGVLDQNDIELCQVNMEIHISEEEEDNTNSEKQKIFMDFVKKIIAEKKYGIFKASENLHMKMYLFNFESEYCKNKF
ncbi:hypothetical protein L3Y34_015997 [Caenorhabditis briggsae]|uniref:Methyltransferase FkbM domain-containing protein n=1 Tax=Caenorhabditis briggsae TaxID=6238 RepID=A0AAE9DV73_CAEBR|nr:hypothetical protein L3Y34_015997 [Caenorhabditis briggsae]